MKRRQRFQNLLNNENRNTSNGYGGHKLEGYSKDGRSSKSGYNLRAFGKDASNCPYLKPAAKKASCSSVVYSKKPVAVEKVPLLGSFAPEPADMEVDSDPRPSCLAAFHAKMQAELHQQGADRKGVVPEHVAEYIAEISDHVRRTEGEFTPEYGYMKRQNDINEKMRAILVDWLIEVHYKFKLNPETLFITVNLIDRYLSKAVVKRQLLQLVGVTAMLIASKYEDIYPPPIGDFVYITDNAYTQQDILEMEHDILRTLEFNVTFPSAFLFLNRYARLAKADDMTMALARYLTELPLIEYRMLKYSASMTAASALYVAFHILKKKISPSWNHGLGRHTDYKESQLRACAKDLCILFHGINKINLQAVKKKFSSSRFFKVGLITLETKERKGPEEKCGLPPKDSFDDSDIPDEGVRASLD